LLHYAVLQGGISGASTYRIHGSGVDAVLKVASRDAPAATLERARRELRFYLDLATAIPVRVPRLLGWAEEESGLALLLAAHAPAQSPRRADFGGIARNIALLHAAFWDKTEALSEYGWLRPANRATDREAVERARQWWRALAVQPATGHLVTPHALSQVMYLLAEISQLDTALEALPLTLCHGDCHTGNLLCDGEGHWIWADWQEVGPARGPEDISFLLQRSAGLPARVEEEIIGAYRDQLAAAGVAIDRDTVRRVMDASELGTWLLHWPVYLLSMPAPEKKLGRMLKRMRDMERRLDL
jgi:aminoglycoside phosphotransferase